MLKICKSIGCRPGPGKKRASGHHGKGPPKFSLPEADPPPSAAPHLGQERRILSAGLQGPKSLANRGQSHQPWQTLCPPSLPGLPQDELFQPLLGSKGSWTSHPAQPTSLASGMNKERPTANPLWHFKENRFLARLSPKLVPTRHRGTNLTLREGECTTQH